MASTLTTVCVFLPIVFTEGITRQLFVDMGLTIAYSLLASLLIALTVVPAMSSKLLVKTKEQKESRFFGGLAAMYEKLLGGALKVKPLVFLVVLGLLAGSVALAFTNGTAFMSDMDSTQLTVNVRLAEDATLAETGALTDQVVEAIRSIDDVQNVGAMTSSSNMALLSGGGGSTNSASVYVVTKEDKSMSNEEIAQLIRDKTDGMDAEITIDTSSMDMSAMGGSGIVIQVQGRDLDTLRSMAEEVAAIVESVEGTTEVSDGLEDADEELRIVIDREEAVHYGLTVAQVYTQVYARLAAASSATTLVADEKDYNVYVMNGNDIELTRELLKQLEIDGTDDTGESVKVPLSRIASFETMEALSSISRADQTRYVSVSAAIAGVQCGPGGRGRGEEAGGLSRARGVSAGIFRGERDHPGCHGADGADADTGRGLHVSDHGGPVPVPAVAVHHHVHDSPCFHRRVPGPVHQRQRGQRHRHDRLCDAGGHHREQRHRDHRLYEPAAGGRHGETGGNPDGGAHQAAACADDGPDHYPGPVHHGVQP